MEHSRCKKIMILGASILQLPAIQKARDMGYDVVALDMNPNAVGFSVDGVIKEVISTIDVDGAVEAAKRHRVDGVMTLATDLPMRAVSKVAQELHLVGLSPEAAFCATDKYAMRCSLQDAGVPVPEFYAVTNEEEYLQAAAKFRVPYIVKPVDSSGSQGVYMVEDLSDPEVMKKAYVYSRPYSHNGMVMVEEHMTGDEFSVETIAIYRELHVIQETDKMTTGKPYFVEMGHTQPSRLRPEIVERIKRTAIAANHAIGIENGPSHTEIIVTKDGPKIVEIGARLGGDCITTHLVPLSTGVDMVKCCIQIALGEKPDIHGTYEKGSATRYFKQHAGTVRRIEGVETAQKIPGVKEIYFAHPVGETVTEIMNSGSRVGFVIAQGENAEDAAKICEEALHKIVITIE